MTGNGKRWFGIPVEAFTPKLVTVAAQGLEPRQIRADVLAGLTVAIVALPLAMAIAIASGATPAQGLVTAIVAGGLISALGGSRVQVGGPTAAFAGVVYLIVHEHGMEGLLLATLMAGIMLVIAGYVRLGEVIRYLPQPVITGFTAGIAVTIASSQIKDFLGLGMETLPPDFIDKMLAISRALPTVHGPTVLVGAGALALILLLKRWQPRLPGYLVAVVIGSLATAVWLPDVATIGTRFGAIQSSLPVPEMPHFSYAHMVELLPSAFTIAFLAGVEALLSAVVADGMTGYNHRPNQELVAQGIANIASATMGGLPATGALARTATNIRAGGRTPVAGLAHALFLLAFMLVAAPLLAYVPLAVLAAILFIVAWGMSEADRFHHLLKVPASDRVVLLLTFLLTVLVDLTVAIGVGVGLAALLFMARMAGAVELSHGIALTQGPEFDQRLDLPPGVEVFRIRGPVFFGMAAELGRTLDRIGAQPVAFILRMRDVPMVDATGAGVLAGVIERYRARGVPMILAAVQEQPATMLAHHGIRDGAPLVHFVPSYVEALRRARELIDAGVSLPGR